MPVLEPVTRLAYANHHLRVHWEWCGAVRRRSQVVVLGVSGHDVTEAHHGNCHMVGGRGHRELVGQVADSHLTNHYHQ